MFESDIGKHRAFSRGSWGCQNSATAWFRVLSLGTEDFSAGGLSRQLDNRRRKEFFTPLFLTPGAFRWRKSAERKAKARLTTCRTRMSYFDIGTSCPIRSAWRLFRERGRTIPWRYSDRRFRSPTAPHCHSLYPLALFPPPALACRTSASAFKGWFLLLPLPTLIGHVTNVYAPIVLTK